MRRVAVVSVLTLSALLGSALRAEAQCLVTPVGPMALKVSVPDPDGPASAMLRESIRAAAPFQDLVSIKLTTPVARRVEGPPRALPPRDYRRGVADAP